MQRDWIDTKTTAKTAEVISITPKKQKAPNLPVGAGSWYRNKTDGLENVADASTTRRDMQSDRNGARTTAKTHETVSKTLMKPKLPNSPVGAKIRRIGEADGWGSHADESNVCRDTQRIKTDTKTAENASRKVKIGQMRSKRQNSPCRVENETAKCPERWKHVSNHGNDTRAPQITPIEDLGTRIRKFIFGQSLEMLGMDKNVEANVEGEKDGGRDDKRCGDVDGTVSSGNDDSNRVAAARLAAQSQQMRKNARMQRNDLPVSPGQPANSRIPFHGVPRTSRRHRTITFESRSISQTHKVKITYLECANVMRSMWRPGNRIRWPNNPVAECESQGECRRTVEDYG